MKTRVLIMGMMLAVLMFVALPAAALAVYRPYYLAADVEPSVYVWNDVFFLKPWGSNAPSTSYIEVCTWSGAKYTGRLVKISEYEIALSQGYGAKSSGRKGSENQVVIPKKNVVMAKIYW